MLSYQNYLYLKKNLEQMASIAERHKYILDCLNKNGYVKVIDISKELDVTPVTIRKDLKY